MVRGRVAVYWYNDGWIQCIRPELFSPDLRPDITNHHKLHRSPGLEQQLQMVQTNGVCTKSKYRWTY